MAQFSCRSCEYQGHFVDFKTGTTHVEDSEDDDVSESYEVDDLACPSCGSESVTED